MAEAVNPSTVIRIGAAAGRAARLLMAAAVVGGAAGLGAALFHAVVSVLTILLTGGTRIGGRDPNGELVLPAAGSWVLLVAPVVTGLVYGPLLRWFAPGTRSQGVTEVMNAAGTTDAGHRLRARRTAVTVAASAVCIAGGGSVGRIGPVVHLGAALGSLSARLAGPAPGTTRILLACGAAGGFSGILGAPLAAPLFAVELVLRRFSLAAVPLALLSGVTAHVVSDALIDRPLDLHPPELPATDPPAYLVFALIGVAGALVGVGFGRCLVLTRRASDRIWRGPVWLRPAVGGVLLGALLTALPQLYGVGDPAVQDALAGAYAAAFLLILLVGKILATSLTFGIGGAGGLFGPMVFLGATAGSAAGSIAAAWSPAAVTVWLCGLVGIGAVLAGAARAPLTAVVALTELAGTLEVLPPLLLACAVATVVSRCVARDTVFTQDLIPTGRAAAGRVSPRHPGTPHRTASPNGRQEPTMSTGDQTRPEPPATSEREE